MSIPSEDYQIAMALLVIVFIYLLTRLRRAVNATAIPSQLSSSRRRLGKYEEYMDVFSNERQGTTNTCYVMTLHSKEKLKVSLVIEALVHLAKRQPMLRAVNTVVSNFSWFGRNSESYFEIIEPNKIRDMIDLTTSDLYASQWQKAWYDIPTRPLKTGLLWQAVLFTEEYNLESKNYVNTIVFRVNHCIMDGVSGMKLFEQFLSYLNIHAQDPRVCGEDVTTLELQPSSYEMISYTRSRSFWNYLQERLGLHFIYKIVKRMKIRMLLSSKPEKPYPFFMAQPSSKIGDLIYNVFSEQQTLQIRKMCKSKGVTVTGALVAAAHVAICKLVQSQNSTIPKEHKLIHRFAINGRRVCETKPPVEYLGHFVLSDNLVFSSNSEDFWSVAQEATEQIKNAISERKYVSTELAEFDIFSPREIIDDLHSPLDPKKKLKLFIESYISSVGAFTIDDNRTSIYKLHECLYYSVPFGFATFATHFNTTVKGKMSWVIICSKFVPQTIEEQLPKLCFNILLREVEQE